MNELMVPSQKDADYETPTSNLMLTMHEKEIIDIKTTNCVQI